MSETLTRKRTFDDTHEYWLSQPDYFQGAWIINHYMLCSTRMNKNVQERRRPHQVGGRHIEHHDGAEGNPGSKGGVYREKHFIAKVTECTGLGSSIHVNETLGAHVIGPKGVCCGV